MAQSSYLRYRTDAPTYRGAHYRVTTKRGPAREHFCAECNGNAAEWAYLGGDPNERVGFPDMTGRTAKFSPNPDYYVPMCRPCHRRADAR